MTSVYESLIWELKDKLKNKNIKFNDLFSLINNQQYNNKNFIIIPDETINTLIEKINTERERIGDDMEKKLNNLLWLNERLVQFDLVAEKCEKRTTIKLLRKELKNKPERCFPLCNAKENVNLKCFLITCRF